MELETLPDTLTIKVSLEGLFDVNPIPEVPKSYAIRRKLTAEEQKVFNNFLAALGRIMNTEIILYRDRMYPSSGRYDADVYTDGVRIFVSKHADMPQIEYTISECPKHQHDGHTFSHKDIQFTWIYGETEHRDTVQLIREYHGYGNGSYYLYSVSKRIVYRKEDD